MYYRLIENNIDKLNDKITKNYFSKNNIYLSDDEAILLTNIAKENWKDLYEKNYEKSFKLIEKHMSKEKANDILNLYLKIISQYLNWYWL